VRALYPHETVAVRRRWYLNLMMEGELSTTAGSIRRSRGAAVPSMRMDLRLPIAKSAVSRFTCRAVSSSTLTVTPGPPEHGRGDSGRGVARARLDRPRHRASGGRLDAAEPLEAAGRAPTVAVRDN
jgi:hypothetical protein